ncbi:HdeD family acid-resistance protein [Enterobacteriaceae bacterium 89]|jgi:membrane protein HdeD|nr:HdeD family acid-resistance protein [Enterobacteriaceae bacterium 89]
MLSISQDVLFKLDRRMLERQRNLLRFIACLMFIGGVLFFVFPFFSGEILSIVLGVVLICSSIAFIAIMIKNRLHNFWPVVSGILISVAYVVVGYLFIVSPATGLFAIAALLGFLFCFGGLIRIMTWFRLRRVKGSWMQAVIGVLDLLIAWCFISATPVASIEMVSMVIGIELIISACSCFGLARQFSKKRV